MVLASRALTQQAHRAALLRPLLLFLMGAAGLQLGVHAVQDCNHAIGLTASARQRLLATRSEQSELVSLISSLPGPVVSENMTALLRAGKSIPFEPAIIKQTTDIGVFDENTLLRRTSDKFFDAFILTTYAHSYRFTPRMLHAIYENYRLVPFPGSTYLVYVRR